MRSKSAAETAVIAEAQTLEIWMRRKYGVEVVKVGDWVRLREIPPWVHDLDFPEVQEVYRYALGRTFQVEGVDEAGKLELWLSPPDHPLGEQVDILHVDPAYVEPVATDSHE